MPLMQPAVTPQPQQWNIQPDIQGTADIARVGSGASTFQGPSNDYCSRGQTHGPDPEPAFKVRSSNDRKALIVKWTGRGMSRVCVA
jgi:hypothetical protein